MIERTISHYKVTAELGRGGMGIVYKAEDTKLERTVALKFLAAHLLADEEARKRFHREAKAAAALSHPNICRVHEIDEVDGRTFIAMEFLEGESLDKRIEQGPLKIAEALDIAQQIAKGLEAAHEKKIVHRDIKPGNVMVDEKGHVTVMDFGLALLTEGSKLTQFDTTLGTAAYMSPEQIQGMEVDHRTDIWALGCVLYEMVCGQRPFKGLYDKALLYEIVQEQPEPLTGLRTGVPLELEWLVGKCLAKAEAERYQNAGDVIVDLRNLEEKLKSGKSTVVSAAAAHAVADVGAASQVSQPSPRRFGWAVTAAMATVVAVTAWWAGSWSTTPPATPRHRLIQLTFDGGLTYQPTISPDGKFVAYASDRAGEGNLDIWVQQIGGGSPPIRVTNDSADDMEPDFSPAGQTIAFHSRRDGAGVYVVPAFGGREKLVAPQGMGPRFSPDGSRIAYWVGIPIGTSDTGTAPSGSVMTVSETGLSPVALAEDFYFARTPVWLADGSGLLFQGRRTPGEPTDWWTVSLDGKLATASRSLKELGDFADASGGPRPRISMIQGSHVIFSLPEFNSQNLWRLRLAEPGWRAAGLPERVTFGPGEHIGGDSARSGRLVFANLTRQIDLWSLPLDGKSGRVTGDIERLTDDPASKGWPAISHNGETVIFVTDRAGNQDVLTLDLESQTRATVAGSSMREGWPLINSTGTKAVYAVFEEDGVRFDLAPLDGGITRTVLASGGRLDDLSPDERLLLYRSVGTLDIMKHDIVSGEQSLVISSEGKRQLYQPHFSPDGQWIVFMKREPNAPSRSRLFVAGSTVKHRFGKAIGLKSLPEKQCSTSAVGRRTGLSSTTPATETDSLASGRSVLIWGRRCPWENRSRSITPTNRDVRSSM